MGNTLFRQSFLIDALHGDAFDYPKTTTLASGLKLTLHGAGVLEVRPPNVNAQTQHVVISVGVHGVDGTPIEMINQLIAEIETGNQPVVVRGLVIIANLEAIKQGQRFIDEDLGLLFDQRPREPSYELAIADTLKMKVKDFFDGTPVESRWHFDLHSTATASTYPCFAMSPKVTHPVRSEALVSFVASADLEALILSNAPSGSFTWHTADAHATQSLTIELGQANRLGESKITRFDGFYRAFKCFLSGQPLPAAKPIKMYRVSRSIVRMHEDFELCLAQKMKNFSMFKHGEVFGHDGDKPLMAKIEEEAILFANPNACIGERAALMICETATRFDQGQLVYD